jgi:antitoxin component YwqK of YwqJK toxin-antitoxin module
MKISIILFSLIVTNSVFASILDDWTDDQICGWMDNPSPPEHMVEEAVKRNLDCATESAKKKAQEDTGLQIMIYDADFSDSDLDELSQTDLNKTDFDFSSYKLANNHRSLECQFEIREVTYETLTEGLISEWNDAAGYLQIETSKLLFDIEKNSSWTKGGLSTDPSYLRDEVNLRLTKDGYLVGKMAFFDEYVYEGGLGSYPIYVELIKHKKSKPLNYKQLAEVNAELWINIDETKDAVMYLRNCSFFDANYKDGKLDGKRTTWHQNGQKKSEINYKDGKREGKSTSWYPSGEIQLEINYINGEKEGLAISWYPNGQKKSEAIYSNNNFIETSWYNNGKLLSETNYFNGKKNGKSIAWYKNNQKKSDKNYKNNVREGKEFNWYQNGQQKSENDYKNGKKEGLSIVWYSSGQIRLETNYYSNVKDGKEVSWYQSGQRKSEKNYKYGSEDGISAIWYESGQIKLEENYSNGKREGKRVTWYDDGQKMYEDNFKNGELDGGKTNWNKNGQIESESIYKEGLLIL